MQDIKCKNHSNTTKYTMMHNTNQCNFKKKIQCSFQPKRLQLKGPENWQPTLLATSILFAGWELYPTN